MSPKFSLLPRAADAAAARAARPYRRGLPTKRSGGERFRRLVSTVLAPTLVIGTIGAAVLFSATAAEATPVPPPTATISLEQTGVAEADPKSFILAGEDATFDIGLTNTSSTVDGFNLAFSVLLPNGIDFVASGDMGSPVVYASGEDLPNSAKTLPLATVPAGSQLWVFEDVADLPATATYTSTLTVRPDAAVFPVGTDPELDLAGYISSQAASRPIFDGSTGVGGVPAAADTSVGTASASTPVQALRLTKSEPSPESELLRGVHDDATTYTLTVESTPQGTTSGVTVVDYLPAGLEFLGCGGVDNTTGAPQLDGTDEYPGSGPISTAGDPGDCLTPLSVETVDSGLPAGYPAGVYTKVTWQLPDLSGDTAQALDLSSAGVPGTYTIKYRAAVPLFENTMDFGSGGAPSPASLEQAANLDNNDGASTRQGQGAGFGDGILYTNRAVVAGTYGGAAASDTDTEDVQAMDLRVLKSVDTGSTVSGDAGFVTGGLATFALELDTGEYASGDSIVLTDALPNGLCPALPAQASPVAITGDPLPSDCQFPYTGAGAPSLTGATVTSIDYHAATGTFDLVLEPTAQPIVADSTTTIHYTALMRDTYDHSPPLRGPTTSGDSVTNHVEFDAWTHSIPGLDGVTSDGTAGGAAAAGDEDVWDDSSVPIVSQLSTISKQVLPRGDVVPTSPVDPSAATSCAVTPADPAWAQNQNDPGDAGFHLGDVVCYQLTVDFATQIDVRNPKVTDFLPVGIDYVDAAVYTGPGGTTPGTDINSFSTDGKRLEWLVGTPGTDGDRFVPLGSKLVIHVLGVVTSLTPNASTDLDKPQNLMKYQQANVLGQVSFLRDSSAIQVDRGISLLKGIQSVVDAANPGGSSALPARSQAEPNGTVFDSNRDGIQVVQGDQVTYRVDLSGAPYAVQGVHVWDALPAGVTKAAVSGITDGGTALDPGDPGYPAHLDGAVAGRSVIVWSTLSIAAGADRTLNYTVTVPPGIALNTDLPNTASITQFDVVLDTGEVETYYPDGSLDTSSYPAAQAVDGGGMRDDSDVYLPAGAVGKVLVGTEVGPGNTPYTATADLDPNNGDTRAVQGELITYQYNVTIPAHTTVENGLLKDRGTLTPGNLHYTVHGTPTWAATAGVSTAGFSLSADGALTFPAVYTNASAADQVFTVTLTVSLGDAGNNNTTLTNQAQFTSDSWSSNATAQVVYVEPGLGIAKTASPGTDVAVGTPITYTLTVTDAAGRPKSYDNVVVDTIPAGLIVDTGSFSVAPSAFDAGIATGAGGSITWDIAALPPTATITYQASMDPTTGGAQQYTNTAAVTGYSLPASVGGDDTTTRRGELHANSSATVTAVSAAIAKGVRLAGSTDPFGDTVSAPIGDTVEYQVAVTLKPNINYYDPVITDDLPAGVVLQDATISGPTANAGAVGITGTWTRTDDAATNKSTWTYDGDILSSSDTRTLTLTYQVLLADGVAAGVNTLPNTAAFLWDGINNTPGSQASVDDPAGVTVLNPVLGIVKSVSDTTPDPGETFGYTLVVTNTGNTPAYNTVIQDAVPTGVVVDAGTISNGGTIVGADPVNGGGTITWDATDLPGPLSNVAPGNTQTLTYSASLAPSSTITDTGTFKNTASVQHYESFPSGGRDYDPTNVHSDATVDPAFPDVTVNKAATGSDVATVGTPFSWTLTAKNTGDGPAQTVGLTDTLPANWIYTAVSSASVGGVAVSPAPVPTVTGSGAVGDPQTLVWSFGAAAPTAPALQPGQSIVIVFTATPSTGALTTPGASQAGPPVVRPPHTNTLAVETTDTSNVDGNASGPYSGPDATADAFIHAADLVLDKQPGSLTAGGAAATAWTISVKNNGPDTSVGPFTVTDTWGDSGVLPAGFAVSGITGTGWSCTPTSTTGFDCARTNANDTLASGASFPDIVVTAQVAASFDPADSPVPNTATVSTTGTYDPNSGNDTDGADVPVSVQADLSIVKTVTGPVPNAGDPISWALTVTNLGLADSVSTTAAPIQVTDTVPNGVVAAVLGTLPAGWSLDPSTPGPVFNAGDPIKLLLADGQRLAPGVPVSFTLAGLVVASWAPGDPIVNTAHVIPGATPDPDTTNNDSDVSTLPTTDTVLGIAKTRVVQVAGGAWEPAVDQTPIPPVVPGDPVTYLITVVNNGTADARNVTATDLVPTYLTYGSFVSASGTWVRNAGPSAAGDDQVFALTGSLAPGASASLRVTLSVAPDWNDPVDNLAQADADNSTNSPQDDDSSDSERSADLSIEKTFTDPGATVVAGGDVGYTLTVTDLGPSYSSGPIVVTDTLPSDDFGYSPGSARAVVDGAAPVPLEPVVSGRTLTWTVGDSSFELPNGATIVITFDATVADATAAGGYTNSAAVSGPDDENPLNDTDTLPTPVTTSADLSIVKTATSPAQPGPYVAGTSVGYTLRVTNAGPSVALDASVSDAAPSGMTVTAMSSADGWTCATLPTCTIAVLPVGTTTITVTASIAASVPALATLTNTATVASSTPDPTSGPGDDSDDETIPVSAQADLQLVKTAVDADDVTPVATAVAGEQVRYLLAVSNLGPSDAVGPLTIADTLPAGLSYVGIADGAADWTCVPDSGNAQLIECSDPAGLAAGGSAQDLVIIVAIDPAQPAGPATNTATVSSPTPEPAGATANNTDDATVTVEQLVDLSIVKSHDPDDVRIGDQLPFDVVVQNAGPSVATAVTVTDTIPAGLEYVDAGTTDPAWTVTAAPTALDGTTTVTATLAGPLGVGASAPSLEFIVLVHTEAYPQVTNVATVAADQTDSDPTDDESDDPVVVPPQSALVLTKEASGDFRVGSDGTYLISVENLGPTEDPGPVVVTDDLPAGLVFKSADGPDVGCTASGSLVTCTVSHPIAVGDTVEITLVVAIGEAAYPNVTNTAEVSTPTEQLPDADPTDTVTTPVAVVPLAATGVDDGALWLWLWLGIGLLVLGAAVVVVVRVRRRR